MVCSAPVLVLLSIAVERALGLHPVRKVTMPILGQIRWHLIVLACSVVPAALAQFAGVWLTHDSLFCWSHPALVVLTQLQGTPVWLMALVCYLIGSACLARTADGQPLPGRFVVLFGIAVVCTVCIAIRPWSLLGSYFSWRQVCVVYGANLLFIAVLGAGWMQLHRGASRVQSLAYATLLYAWLFTYAFPFFVIE